MSSFSSVMANGGGCNLQSTTYSASNAYIVYSRMKRLNKLALRFIKENPNKSGIASVLVVLLIVAKSSSRIRSLVRRLIGGLLNVSKLPLRLVNESLQAFIPSPVRKTGSADSYFTESNSVYNLASTQATAIIDNGAAERRYFAEFPPDPTDTVLKSSLSELSLLMDSPAGSTANLKAFNGETFNGKETFVSRKKLKGYLPSGLTASSASIMGLKNTTGLAVAFPGLASVDTSLFRKCILLCRLAVPTLLCRESLTALLLLLALVTRTFMSIWIASIHGSVVKSIVDRNIYHFMKTLAVLVSYSLPASIVNSSIEYLGKQLALHFRQRLTRSFLRRYFRQKVFYHVTALDNRILHPDQRFTEDIVKWADALSSIFSSITKPVLDIIFLSTRLAKHVGIGGPMIIILWYCLTALVTKWISPAYDQFITESQNLEGEYRKCHTSVVNHSEEIAFYRGNFFELRRMMRSFEKVVRHTKKLQLRNFFMGCFDNLLAKHGAVIVGYGVIALPVFGWSRISYFSSIGNDPSQLTLDYVRNSSLLINLAKAIGRIVISYKDIQRLSGLTHLVCELNDVLDNIQSGCFCDTNKQGTERWGSIRNHGELHESECIEFVDVPIYTPRGDLLVDAISFSIARGSNLFILGPNGCGKSSLFRVLGELWPLRGGKLFKPPASQLFYIPQRPNLPDGTLRDQIIYPDTMEIFFQKNYRDEDLRSILDAVSLTYLVQRSNNSFDTWRSWDEELSGGEKQRIAVARVCYHSPVFALLDEATSAVSVDVESDLYRHMKSQGISLITVSHRMHLLKHHEFVLKFNGHGTWSFDRIDLAEIPRYQSYSNFLKLGGA